MEKHCPFNENKICNNNCPLFVSPEALNDYVVSKLCSIGVFDKNNGECSLKLLALSQGRMMFEQTNTR